MDKAKCSKPLRSSRHVFTVFGVDTSGNVCIASVRESVPPFKHDREHCHVVSSTGQSCIHIHGTTAIDPAVAARSPPSIRQSSAQESASNTSVCHTTTPPMMNRRPTSSSLLRRFLKCEERRLPMPKDSRDSKSMSASKLFPTHHSKSDRSGQPCLPAISHTRRSDAWNILRVLPIPPSKPCGPPCGTKVICNSLLPRTRRHYETFFVNYPEQRL